MPNAKGGKGYKKGKHDDSEAQLIECDASQNQMYARVMKSLGNRRFRVFSNDNKERICRVCGSMRKSQWVEQGGIVIISIRELSMSTVHGSTDDKDKDVKTGDIIGLVDHSLIGKLKKVDGINPLLFTNVETRESALLKKSIKAQEDGVTEDDDFFTRGSDSEEKEDAIAKREQVGDTPLATFGEKRKEREVSINAARDTKYNVDENGDINIDDI
jgi:initiation factor 1A